MHRLQRRVGHALRELDRPRRRLHVALARRVARLREHRLVHAVRCAIGRLGDLLGLLLPPCRKRRLRGGDLREGVEGRVEQLAAVGGDGDEGGLGELEHAVRADEGPVLELLRLAGQPAHGVGQHQLPHRVDARERAHVVAAVHAPEEQLELVVGARHVDQPVEEVEVEVPVGEEGHGAVEGRVLPRAVGVIDGHPHGRGVHLLTPCLGLTALALRVLPAGVELLEGGADEVHAVDAHPVERGELGEVVLERVLEQVGRAERHRVHDDVAEVVVAVTNERGARCGALVLRHRVPRLVADGEALGGLGGRGDEPLGLALAVAGVAHDHRLLGQPMQANL